MKQVKYKSKLSEWNNLMEGIDRVSMAANIPQLTGLDLSGIATIADRIGTITSASEMAMRNIEMMAKPLEMVYMPETQLSGIKTIVSQMGAFSSAYDHVRMTENLGNTLSMISSLAEQVSMPIDRFSGMLEATQAFHDRLSFIDTLGLDQARLTSAVSIALQRLSEIKEYEIEDISPLVAECYEAETEEEKETLKSVVTPAETKEQTEVQKKFSLYVWKIIIFLLGAVASGIIQSSIDKVMNDNPPVINQYYIKNITNNLVVEGYDVDGLNGWGYRIVNRDIILRAKPGRSSYVTGRLTKGTIVRVVGKYEKWVEVTWNDESGEAHFGWIQNYKLSVFSD